MKVFYHNDHDGYCAGAIIANYTGNYNKDDYFEVDYINNTIQTNKISIGEQVYIVDYSFKENTVHILDKIVNEMKCDVIFIDHHDSTLKLQEQPEYTWIKDIKGIRSKDYCGAMLTCMYLYNTKYDVPYFIELIDDYDCWKYNFGDETTYFKLGLETMPFNALDNIWRFLFKEHIENIGLNVLEDVIEKGKLIKTYIDNNNKYHKEKYAYETEIAGYKCLAINRRENAWIFGEDYNNYQTVMVSAFNGECWQYTLYSSDKTVDCGAIAESYGGGGHRGAAGFNLKDMPFIKTASTTIIKEK